ncbi:MAG TPA: diversity-generating retroelement protein Avd [Candidatus Blackburnbacteria bacterium]|nr:diversity-generating retroelement protein Avd [Candidatus Blackburnbacteria bacterium]
MQIKIQIRTFTHTHTHTAYSALDIPIFAKAYEFYKRLTLAIAAFPKTKRYTLGQKLDNITLEILELLFSVPVAQNKILALQQISIKLDLLKVLLRIAKDIQAISNKNYLELETILQEIGRMLGGWIRAVKQSSP